MTVDAENPSPENWVDFIPETEHVLSPSKAGGYFFAEYMVDAVSEVKQYDYAGKLIREVKLPGVGTEHQRGYEWHDRLLRQRWAQAQQHQDRTPESQQEGG